MPRVSVILPAFNAEAYIKEAIESILGQTFRDFELIVINDCSADGTEAVILSFGDDRLVYVKNEENLGVAATLNRGLALARGEYIARMDADDISLPRRLELQAACLDAHPDIAVLGTNVETFDENGPQRTGWSATDPRQMNVDLFFSCGIAHPSVMMRKSVIEELGGYDREFEGLEDYELWCRVSKGHGVTTLPEVLFRYRVHSGQVTKNPSPKYLQRLQTLKKRQLSELGLPENEFFLGLCTGSRPQTKEELLTAAAFFEAVLAANRAARRYDEGLLADSFRSILLSPTAALSGSDRRAVTEKTTLISDGDIRRYTLKRKLKRLLGR